MSVRMNQRYSGRRWRDMKRIAARVIVSLLIAAAYIFVFAAKAK